MKIKYVITLFISLTCFFVQAQSNYNGEGPFNQLIIRGVTLINGNGAPPMGPVDIVVENNIIKSIKVVGYPGLKIESKNRPKLKSGGKELDANGMFLLPGFIEMHGHIGGKAQGADPDYVFRLWMAHGITTVREPSGRGLNFSLKLKKQSNAHKIVAPRLFIYTGFGQGSKTTITTAQQARAWVQQNAKNGADGIKFFGGSPEVLKAALSENKKLGLKSAFHHAQLSVARWNVLNSARAGLTSMEHWYGLPEALFT